VALRQGIVHTVARRAARGGAPDRMHRPGAYMQPAQRDLVIAVCDIRTRSWLVLPSGLARLLG